MSDGHPATLGHFLGLQLPAKCNLHLSVHGLSVEHFEALLAEAGRHDANVKAFDLPGLRYVEVRKCGHGVTVFAPDDLTTGACFEDWVVRKMAFKFVEIGVPS